VKKGEREKSCDEFQIDTIIGGMQRKQKKKKKKKRRFSEITKVKA
jgi:hypothetical protein